MNQPIYVLAISLIALYFSELHDLTSLYIISLVLSIITSIAIIIMIIYYSYDYCKRKLWNAKWNTKLLKKK